MIRNTQNSVLTRQEIFQGRLDFVGNRVIQPETIMAKLRRRSASWHKTRSLSAQATLKDSKSRTAERSVAGCGAPDDSDVR